jgi:hypothetical protein
MEEDDAPMGPARVLIFAAAVVFFGLTATGHESPAPGPAGQAADPLAAEIGRWSKFVSTHPSKDENWEQIESVVTPVLSSAEKALADGRRLLALQNLARARTLLAATVYVGEHPAERKDEAAFEAEWKRMGAELRADLGATPPGALEGLKPAAVRGLAEAALPQVRIYYDASLEYGRSTMPDAGLFYLGSARAQREFVAFCRTLSLPSPPRAPALRPLAPDLDGLEAKLLSAYRPPASIDRHAEFIAASAALKEARELDAAGLRYGALVRYLQAALRVAPLLPPGSAPAAAETLAGFENRLAGAALDHSIGRIFLESAQADLAANPPPARAASAEAIAAEALPRYFAALEPAAPGPARPAPAVTVTLVRWPYT